MLRLISCFLIILAAAGAPWFLGGSSPWCYALAPATVLLSALIFAFSGKTTGVSSVSWGAVGGFALLLGFIWLQAMPLPRSVLNIVVSKERLARLDQLVQVEENCRAEVASTSPNHWDRISADPPETRRQWSILAVALIICVIAMVLASDELCRLMMVFLLAINGAAFGVLGLFQRASAPGMIYWTIKPPFFCSPFGAFVNSNHAGLFLALSGLLALFGICLLLSQRIVPRELLEPDSLRPAVNGKSRRGAVSLTDLRVIWLSQKDSVLFSLAIAAMFCAVSSIVAASRSGALAFGAVIVVSTLMLFVAGANRRLIGAIGVLGGLAAVVSGAKFAYLMERFEANAIESGWQGRIDHWSDVLDQSSEFALTGTGYGSYAYSTLPYLSRPVAAWFQHADNQFVEVFVELGIIGSAMILVAIGLFAARCTSLLRKRDPQSRIVGLLGFGLLAIGAINAMGDFALAMSGVLLPLSLASGLVLGYRSTVLTPQHRSPLSLLSATCFKLAILGLVTLATCEGVSHFANGQGAVEWANNPPQWLARRLAKITRETNSAALTGDAEAATASFLDRVRRASQAAEPELTNEEVFTLENLALVRQAAAIDNSDALIRSLEVATQTQDELVGARDNYLQAVRLSPMRWETHLALARLDLLQCPGHAVRHRVNQVLLVHPSSCVDKSKVGMISIINSDYEIGGELLARALRESPPLEGQIFTALKATLTVEDIAKYVLKQDAKLLIVATGYYSAPTEWLARNYLFSKLRFVLEGGPNPELSEGERKFFLAKCKRMAADLEGAQQDLEAACKDPSARPEWFAELATIYEEQGNFRDAIRVLKKRQLFLAYDETVEQRIVSLEKRQRLAP